MTSPESRMLAGEPYLADDPELAVDHARAQRLLARFNAIRGDEVAAPAGVLAVGDPCRIVRDL